MSVSAPTLPPPVTARPSVPLPLEKKAVFPALPLLLLFTISLTLCIDSAIMGALVTPLKAAFHLTDEQIGRLRFAFSLVNLGLCPVIGYLGDRYPRKPIMLIGVVLFSLATAAGGLATGFAGLLISRMFVGGGADAYQLLWPSFITDLFAARWRNVAFGFMRITGPVGWCIGFLVTGIIEANFGWRAAFYIAGLPGLLLALAGFFFLHEPKRGAVDGHHIIEIPEWHAGLTLFKNVNFLVYALGSMSFGIALGALGDWGPAFLHRAYGLTNREATSFFAYGWLIFQASGGLIGGVIGSILKRRFPHGYFYHLGVALAFASGLLFHGLLSHDLQTTQNFIRAEMFFAGLSMGAVSTVMMDLVPVALRNNAVAMTALIAGTLGAFLSSELIGLISDRFGLGAGILVVPAAFATSSLAWWTLLILHWFEKPAAAPHRHSV